MDRRMDKPPPNREVQEGMEVLGTEGRLVGYVTQVRKSDFCVHREIAGDIYLPYHLVAEIKGNAITLSVTNNRLAAEQWLATRDHQRENK